MAAEFAPVDRMPPQLVQRMRRMPFEPVREFRLTARHQRDEPRLVRECERNGVVGRRITGVKRGDDMHRAAFRARRADLGGLKIEPVEAK